MYWLIEVPEWRERCRLPDELWESASEYRDPKDNKRYLEYRDPLTAFKAARALGKTAHRQEFPEVDQLRRSAEHY